MTHAGRIRHTMYAVALAAMLAPDLVAAQGGLLGRARRRIEENAGRRVERAVDCAMGDQTCIDKAQAEGKQVKIDSTKAASGQDGAAAAGVAAGESSGGATGSGSNAIWSNYDFVPGTRTIFFEDYKNDPVGDFPRRFEFVDGNIELATYRDRTWLRFVSTGRMYVPLPAVLPQRYTMEFDFWGTAGECWVHPDGTVQGGARIEFGSSASGGIARPTGDAMSSGTSDQQNLIHMGRVMVDGNYAKIYVNARRVANVPNFNIERANRIGFYCDAGMAIGGIRVAEGGRKLYDALAADGRVATQGVYFDTGSDRIRPESAPTLKEIAAMITEHPELKLGIEGHTDNVGQAPANLDLSRRRAEAVKTYLVGTLRVDATRVTATGLGSTKPAQPNATPEGRQTNRRVELVKLQ
jgi:OmpA-OmpF porin, OOP family